MAVPVGNGAHHRLLADSCNKPVMGFFLKMRPLEPDSDTPSLSTMTLQGTSVFSENWRYTMTPEEVVMVQESWKQVLPISDKAAELFYGRLFEIAPEVQPYFKGDMAEQGKKLMAMINTAVNSLNELESVVPAVQAMAVRHVGYGVKPEDYDSVGAALIWTLDAGLGDAFTDDVRDAWVKVYTTLADVMKTAAYH